MYKLSTDQQRVKADLLAAATSLENFPAGKPPSAARFPDTSPPAQMGGPSGEKSGLVTIPELLKFIENNILDIDKRCCFS